MKFLKKNETKTKKTHKVEMGTLYDMNKSLVSQLKDLTDEEIQEKKDLLTVYFKDTLNTYYMLLCNERKDYTVFRLLNRNDIGSISQAIDILVDECLYNRGKVKSIDLTENKDAIEIWIVINDECYCYYFFPYDEAIIEC